MRVQGLAVGVRKVVFGGFLVLVAGCATPPDLKPLEASILNRPARLEPALAGSDFGRAVARAVAASPAVGRSQAALREREADLLASGGTALPELSLGLRPDGGIGFGVSAFASISQLVFDAGAGKAQERAAEARVLGGVAGRIEARSQATFAAVAAWAEVATAARLVEAAEASLAALEETERRIAERTEAGAGASSDLLVAQSRLANERASVVEARTALARAEAAFVEVFGQSPRAGLGLPPRSPSLPAGGLADSPLLLQGRAEVLAAEADLAAAQAGRVPALSVQVTGTEGRDGLTAGPRADQTVAPTRRTTARVAAAEARLEARKVDLDAATRELESRLNRLRAEQAAALDRLEAARAASDANRANVTAAREQFDVGRRSLIELLDAEREALASERMRIIAERDRVLSGHALLAVTGDILAVFGIDATGPQHAPRDGAS